VVRYGVRPARCETWRLPGASKFQGGSSKHFLKKPSKTAPHKKLLLLFSRIGYISRADSEVNLQTLKTGRTIVFRAYVLRIGVVTQLN
jgi:hypothetical protein